MFFFTANEKYKKFNSLSFKFYISFSHCEEFISKFSHRKALAGDFCLPIEDQVPNDEWCLDGHLAQGDEW